MLHSCVGLQHIPGCRWSMAEVTALFSNPPGKLTAYAPILSFKLVYFSSEKVGDVWSQETDLFLTAIWMKWSRQQHKIATREVTIIKVTMPTKCLHLCPHHIPAVHTNFKSETERQWHSTSSTSIQMFLTCPILTMLSQLLMIFLCIWCFLILIIYALLGCQMLPCCHSVWYLVDKSIYIYVYIRGDTHNSWFGLHTDRQIYYI